MKETDKTGTNSFLNHLGKFIGREVVVHYQQRDETIIFEGVCEAIDFHHKAIIIRDAKETILIPRYICVKRKRKHPDGNDE